MAKPKAPRWLTEAFALGVDELVPPLSERHGAYAGAWAHCFPAHHDPARLPCDGLRGYERFHFIPRQRVENALGALLPEFYELDFEEWVAPAEEWEPDDLILLAAWDPRNGGLGCEHHHRRLDGHACSPRAPKIVIPAFDLPEHVDDFVHDYDLEGPAEERFVDYAPVGDGDRAYLWTAP